MINFEVGKRARFTATFSDRATGALVDPPTVRFILHNSSAGSELYRYTRTSTDNEISKISTGVYRVDVLITYAMANTSYLWGFFGIGGGLDGSEDGAFTVKATSFSDPLA